MPSFLKISQGESLFSKLFVGYLKTDYALIDAAALLKIWCMLHANIMHPT